MMQSKGDKRHRNGASQPPEKPRGAASSVAGVPNDVNPTVDDWLTENLRKIYDPVLTEPLPKKLRDLLRSYEDK